MWWCAGTSSNSPVVPSLAQSHLSTVGPLWLVLVELFRISTFPSSDLVESESLVVNQRPGTAVLHVDSIELNTTSLVRFLQTAEWDLFGSQCYNSQIGQGGFDVLVLLSSGVLRCVISYIFAFPILGCSFDLALAYFACRRSEDVNWFSVEVGHQWFLWGFANSHVNDLVQALVPSRKTNASTELCAHRLWANRPVLFLVPSAGRGSLAKPIAYMLPPSWVYSKASGPPHVCPSVSNV